MPTLVIMAAGLGSRFGSGKGQKQVTPIADRGHLIIDYSIYDAVRAGFDRVVFVVKPESEQAFHEVIGKRVEPFIEVKYAHQTMTSYLPDGVNPPEGREKPWGTGHACLCAKDNVPDSFVVINADDFYGAGAFKAAMQFIKESTISTEHAMVGYKLRNTMTPNGSVARGVCETDDAGYLKAVVERTKIVPRGDDAAYTEDGETFVPLSGDSIVSLNLWVFKHGIFDEAEARFHTFVKNGLGGAPLKKEFFLPDIPKQLLREGKATIRVLKTSDKWFGITYMDDVANTKMNIAEMVKNGAYPERLWGE